MANTIRVTRARLIEMFPDIFSSNQKGYNAVGAWLKQLEAEGKAEKVGREEIKSGSPSQGGLSGRTLKKPGRREVWLISGEFTDSLLVQPEPEPEPELEMAGAAQVGAIESNEGVLVLQERSRYAAGPQTRSPYAAGPQTRSPYAAGVQA